MQPYQKDWLMSTLFHRLVKDESGATAIEYGLIAALLAIAIIAALNTVSVNLNTVFGRVATELGNGVK